MVNYWGRDYEARVHACDMLNFTEQAKKLLKSGVIKVDSANKAKQFKRARIDRGSTSKVSIIVNMVINNCLFA